MAIYRLLQNSVLDPDNIKTLTDAYEAVLVRLNRSDRSDPITELIARTIVDVGQTGICDPQSICELVVREYARK